MTERLELLLRELEAMTLELPEATVLAAGRRVAIFVASRTAHGGAGSGAGDDELLPMQLGYDEGAAEGAEPTGAAADDDRLSEAGSIGLSRTIYLS